MTIAITKKLLAVTVPVFCACLWAQEPAGSGSTRAYPKQDPDDTVMDRLMTPMGRMSYRIGHGLAEPSSVRARRAMSPAGPDSCEWFDVCADDDSFDLPSGARSETAIAIDATGQHIVIGYNDFRGFSLNPVSGSGFAYSDDGGLTFTDGGQLPVAADGQLQNGTKFPRVSGDPDVKYVPGGNGCQFVYVSLFTKGFGPAPNYLSGIGTLAIHRSTDCGHTWEGPFEVPGASNPNGQLVNNETAALDGADKELIDVDPQTGRVIVTWSNFTSGAFRRGGAEISSTYSDDIMTGNPPTWSDRVVLNLAGSAGGAQASMPRFAGDGTDLLYVVWDDFGTRGTDIAMAASPNKGLSFAPPVRVNPAPFIAMDNVLGNDRPHDFAAIATDRSPGPNRGNIYIVYTNNDLGDGADIVFQRSTDRGLSFSPPIYLNSNPGADRAQWFPFVAVDNQTGRVSVLYYDQGCAASGDMTELAWTYSDDGGVTWSKPSPLSPRPFHAGYGNDQSQPNLGDYIGAVAQGGAVYVVYATTPSVALFTDGQAASPDGRSYPYPNAIVQKGITAQLPVRLGNVTFTDSGGNGFIDAGDQVRMRVPLTSYVLNPVFHPTAMAGLSATLSTSTPGVTVMSASSSYGAIAPGATMTNARDFVFQIAPDFVPGAKIEFALTVASPQGTAKLLFTQNTGTPVAKQIFAEDFESVAPGSLPPGWNSSHVAPAPPQNVSPPPPGYVVPWTTDNSFCGTSSNGLFHINANDGPTPASGSGTPNPARWEGVVSPRIMVPADSQYVTVDFDICYDTEDDGDFAVTGYDGVIMQITDLTPGRTTRSSLVEAFAEWIRTGDMMHYPKHFPRSGSSAYFQDMSAWSGFSNGFQHVSMRLNGMQGSTINLRWDFTQDSSLTCADMRFGHACGVIIDNIVVNSITSQSSPTPVEGEEVIRIP